MVKVLISHQCVLVSILGPGVICGVSLLLVLYSAPRGFSPSTLVFPILKPNISKFQFDLDYRQALARVIVQALPVFDVKFTYFLYNASGMP